MESDLSFDESSFGFSQGVDHDLIKELVELRQMRGDRESLLRTNHYYASQLSGLEVRISELKALNDAKDLEISKLKTKLRKFSSRGSETERESTRGSFSLHKQDFEARFGFDEEQSQNEILRIESARLKLEVAKAKQDKSDWEEKSKEVTEKVNILESANKDLEDQLRNFQEVRTERDYLKNEMIPMLEKTIKLYQKNKEELENELENQQNKRKRSPISSRLGRETQEENPFIYKGRTGMKPKVSPKNSRAGTGSFASKPYVQIKIPNTGISIMARNSNTQNFKDNITKRAPTNSQPAVIPKKPDESMAFADNFPDEEELEI
ncbi:unnamed protein product [Blepharisma stoltei]|uniref:Uncharacterized protein n=1 Tax=Blepharisma stoltei TaxID=1481888 RepID=A0AAU9J4I8_9CILI|nr:unnamed protein product [Blepharisma stoltei]